MICPHCKVEAKFYVKETRLIDGDIVRRKTCRTCGEPCMTRERIEDGLSIITERDREFFRKAKIAAKEKRKARKPNDNPLFGVWK